MRIFSTGKNGAWTKYSQILVALFWIIVKAINCHYVLEKLSLYLTSTNQLLII